MELRNHPAFFHQLSYGIPLSFIIALQSLKTPLVTITIGGAVYQEAYDPYKGYDPKWHCTWYDGECTRWFDPLRPNDLYVSGVCIPRDANYEPDGCYNKVIRRKPSPPSIPAP